MNTVVICTVIAVISGGFLWFILNARMEATVDAARADMTRLQQQVVNLSGQLAKVQGASGNEYINGTNSAAAGVAGTLTGLPDKASSPAFNESYVQCPAGSFVSAIQGFRINSRGDSPFYELRYACRSVNPK
jgi:hypothetical protein